jgi:hypothetical protein
MEPEYDRYTEPLRNRSNNGNIYIPENMRMDPFQFPRNFTINDLLNCINKSIYVTNEYIKGRYTPSTFMMFVLQHITPLKQFLLFEDDNITYYFDFRSGSRFQCRNGNKKCLSEADLPNVSMHSRMMFNPEIGTNTGVIYIGLNGELVGAFYNFPEFNNSLTEKEYAFVRAMYNNFTLITPEGIRFANHGYFTGTNLSGFMAVPTNRERHPMLTWSNRVNVQNIPRNGTRPVPRRGGKRRVTKRRVTKRRVTKRRVTKRRVTKRH